MAELVRTNDPGIISVIEGLLGGAGVPYQVTDRNMPLRNPLGPQDERRVRRHSSGRGRDGAY